MIPLYKHKMHFLIFAIIIVIAITIIPIIAVIVSENALQKISFKSIHAQGNSYTFIQLIFLRQNFLSCCPTTYFNLLQCVKELKRP